MREVLLSLGWLLDVFINHCQLVMYPVIIDTKHEQIVKIIPNNLLHRDDYASQSTLQEGQHLTKLLQSYYKQAKGYLKACFVIVMVKNLSSKRCMWTYRKTNYVCEWNTIR